MGTKNNPGEFDCYANAAPDEPLFILLGRDRHGPALVRAWALLRHKEGELPAKIAEALAAADAMEDCYLFRNKHLSDVMYKLDAYHNLLTMITEGMQEHPEGYDGPCVCNACLSYC